MKFTNIEDQTPLKGKNIEAIDSNGQRNWCFRCNCDNDRCKSWRCSTTGYELVINVVKWRYV